MAGATKCVGRSEAADPTADNSDVQCVSSLWVRLEIHPIFKDLESGLPYVEVEMELDVVAQWYAGDIYLCWKTWIRTENEGRV